MDAPLVSVWMITYNHEKYIRQALETVFSQIVNFEFEIVIGEDCSTDNTRSIIAEFQLLYPAKLFPIYHNVNVGAFRNAFEYCLPKLRGKYVAILEGDDYWTDPYKLQKQVDFLEGNLEYRVAYHRVDVLGMENTPLTLANQAVHESYSFGFADSLQGKHGATLSMVFRADVIKQIPLDFISKLAVVGDWPLECCCTLLGKGYFLNESMGVYRVHNQGMNNTLKKSDFFNSRIGLAEHLRKLPVSQKYRSLLKKFLFRTHILKFSHYLQTSHKTTALKALLESAPYFYMNCLSDDINWENNFQIKGRLQKLLTKLRRRFSV